MGELQNEEFGYDNGAGIEGEESSEQEVYDHNAMAQDFDDEGDQDEDFMADVEKEMKEHGIISSEISEDEDDSEESRLEDLSADEIFDILGTDETDDEPEIEIDDP